MTLALRPGRFVHPRPANMVGTSSLVLTGTLAGFLLTSYIPGLIGVDSRTATIPFRGLMLFVLIYAFYRLLDTRRLRIGTSMTTLLAVFFGTAYCLRFIVDAGLLNVPLGSSPSDMALYLFAMCLPTFLVLYQVRDISLYRLALPWTMLALGGCCAASMGLMATPQNAAQSQNRGNDILNHIAYGHMGVTATVLGLFVVLQIGGARNPWFMRLLAMITLCLGAFTILAAASRGALVAGMLLIPVVMYLGMQKGARLLTLGISIVLVGALTTAAADLSRRGVDLKRLLGSAAAYSTANESVYTRQNMARDAWRQYLDHPWLGSSIVERNSLSYPHNSLVEAFMATGTFGGTAFVLLLFIAVSRAIRLMKRSPVMAWVPICFFQYLIGAMFSGGLYSNPAFWGMTAIVLGADLPRLPNEGRAGG